MYDYDAKNHLKDLYREADQRRLVRLAEAANADRRKPRRRSILASSLQLLTLKLAR